MNSLGDDEVLVIFAMNYFAGENGLPVLQVVRPEDLTGISRLTVKKVAAVPIDIVKSALPGPENKGYEAPKVSPEGSVNTERFLSKYIITNAEFSIEERQQIADHVRKQRGPWSVRDLVTKVIRDENTVIIEREGSGTSFIYLNKS